MPNDHEAELKKVEGNSKTDSRRLRRDPSLTGGERAETPNEKAALEREKRRPKQPPIIQRDAS